MQVARVSERAFSEESGLSRLTVRALKREGDNCRIGSYALAAESLGRQIAVVAFDRSSDADLSVQATSFLILKDGFGSWKIHVMNFVDHFRKTLDGRLLLLPPTRELDLRLQALLQSIVVYLCREVGIQSPPWAQRQVQLSEPWFPSESEALKAMMILESPMEFRRNQIFVGENFLSRA